jgi:hypothetical protein
MTPYEYGRADEKAARRKELFAGIVTLIWLSPIILLGVLFIAV